MNPIENIWNDLKYYLCTKVKPSNKKELCRGIKKFWKEILNTRSCNKKIDHLYNVYKRVIMLRDRATGF